MSLIDQPADPDLEDARGRYFDALGDIDVALRRLCPQHSVTQKRDGHPPWCSRCGRGRLGTLIGKPS